MVKVPALAGIVTSSGFGMIFTCAMQVFTHKKEKK
jgi:hypothetical protein